MPGSVAEEPNLEQQRLCPPSHLQIASRCLPEKKQHASLQAPRHLKFADPRRDSNAKNPVHGKISLDFTFPPKPSRAIVHEYIVLAALSLEKLLKIYASLLLLMD